MMSAIAEAAEPLPGRRQELGGEMPLSQPGSNCGTGERSTEREAAEHAARPVYVNTQCENWFPWRSTQRGKPYPVRMHMDHAI